MIPGLGRSPAEGNSYPLQYSCLGNSMNRGAWKATVHGVTKSCDMTESLSLSQDSLPLNMNKRAGKTTLFRICPFTLNSMSSQPSCCPGPPLTPASPHLAAPSAALHIRRWACAAAKVVMLLCCRCLATDTGITLS